MKKIREDNIKKLTEKKIVKDTLFNHKKGRILLVKRDPNKPKKYNWELKLTPTIEEKQINDNNKKNRTRSKSAHKHKPLEKAPDYLTEMRLQKNDERNSNSSQSQYRGKKWDKMINNNKNSLMENVENIKMKAEILENKAKMNEKLLQTKGEFNAEMQENVSNLLIDAIKAKLTILENINK